MRSHYADLKRRISDGSVRGPDGRELLAWMHASTAALKAYVTDATASGIEACRKVKAPLAQPPPLPLPHSPTADRLAGQHSLRLAPPASACAHSACSHKHLRRVRSALQLCGGHGYASASALPALAADYVASCTLEVRDTARRTQSDAAPRNAAQAPSPVAAARAASAEGHLAAPAQEEPAPPPPLVLIGHAVSLPSY
jgi:hypothetical protein